MSNAVIDTDTSFEANSPKISCRPFVKWAGGKSKLLSELTGYLPQTFGSYYEGFVGGGALFFELQPEKAVLIDRNAELITTYTVIRDTVEELLEHLRRHVHDKDYYYSMRDADRSEDFKRWSPIERASRFIFLNKTCFNGLYRVNSRGEFNVPFGDYSAPTIADDENLRRVSEVLKAADLLDSGFDSVADRAVAGDFVYFDPPYAPLSKTANFTSYSAGGFSIADQVRLRDVCRELANRGVSVMITNSLTELVMNLYRDFYFHIVSAPRAINSRADKRGPVQELVITSYRTPGTVTGD